jgi:GNAT superfamily N-acetyltransferase
VSPGGAPYAPGDLSAVTGLLLACRAAGRVELYPGAAELRLIVPADPEEAAANARVWRAGSGEPTAFALFDPHWRSLTFFVAPAMAVRDAARGVLDWGMRTAAANPPKNGAVLLRVRPRDSDREVIVLLEERGFTREDWGTLRYARDLREPIPEPRLPDGYAIRHLSGEGELDAYCAMHRDAFGTEYMTAERRLPLLRDPGYDPELDLVAVAPDGELAAFVYCSVDAEENARLPLAQGWTDPVGTRPAHRRRGLSTALVLEGFRRLRARGVDRAYTGTADGNTAMRGVCAAVGYRLQHTVLSYAWSPAVGVGA